MIKPRDLIHFLRFTLPQKVSLGLGSTCPWARGVFECVGVSVGKHNILPTDPGALSPGSSHESNEPGDPIAAHLPMCQPIPGWQSPGGWQCPGLQVRWQRRRRAWLPCLPPAWSLALQLQAQGNFKGKSKLHLSLAQCGTCAAGVGWGGAGSCFSCWICWELLGFRASPGACACQEKSPLGWHESQFSTCSEKHLCSQLPTMTSIWQELEK